MSYEKESLATPRETASIPFDSIDDILDSFYFDEVEEDASDDEEEGPTTPDDPPFYVHRHASYESLFPFI